MAEETLNEKWVRISESRLEKAEKAISLLAGNLATGYEFSPEQAEALMARLDAAVDEVREAYGQPERGAAAPEASVEDMAEDAGDEADEEATEVVAEAAAPAAQTSQVAAPFPSEEEDMILLRVGSRIDNAITMIEKGQSIEAKAILQAMMVA